MKYTPICPICHKPITQGGVFLHEAPHLLLCDSCGIRFWTCISCEHGETCAFRDNPQGLPPVIMQTVRQGNMLIQQQVMNPELVNHTCKAGCKCWNTETETCCKQTINACENHQLASIYQEPSEQPQ